MNNFALIEKLKAADLRFSTGMSEGELDRAESVFGFRFPREIRAFLSLAVPVGEEFFDYRDLSEENQKAFQDFQNRMEAYFRFDLANNRGDMLERLAEPLGNPEDFDGAVLDFFHSSVKLIPFYVHRCFYDGMDGMPIVSFWQPVDSIFYGSDFQDYLEVEFLGKELDVQELPEQRLRETGIWQYLVTP